MPTVTGSPPVFYHSVEAHSVDAHIEEPIPTHKDLDNPMASVKGDLGRLSQDVVSPALELYRPPGKDFNKVEAEQVALESFLWHELLMEDEIASEFKALEEEHATEEARAEWAALHQLEAEIELQALETSDVQALEALCEQSVVAFFEQVRKNCTQTSSRKFFKKDFFKSSKENPEEHASKEAYKKFYNKMCSIALNKLTPETFEHLTASIDRIVSQRGYLPRQAQSFKAYVENYIDTLLLLKAKNVSQEVEKTIRRLETKQEKEWLVTMFKLREGQKIQEKVEHVSHALAHAFADPNFLEKNKSSIEKQQEELQLEEELERLIAEQRDTHSRQEAFPEAPTSLSETHMPPPQAQPSPAPATRKQQPQPYALS